MKRCVIILFIVMGCCNVFAADDLSPVYPMGESADIRPAIYSLKDGKFPYMFEANPTIRYKFHNNIVSNLAKSTPWMFAVYLNFNPQIRMFKEKSSPVQTPSYKISLGTQHLFRITSKHDEWHNRERFFGIALEHGHYSNGQSGCSFSTELVDDTGPCRALHNGITSTDNLSEMLNRENGNFQTNVTSIILNYRQYSFKGSKNIPSMMFSAQLGYSMYHKNLLVGIDFGGYSDNDIEIYGKHRIVLNLEYKIGSKKSWSFKYNSELIQGAHEHVNPYRGEFRLTHFPWIKHKALGYFIEFELGHDNYNYRFVDDIKNISVGFTWEQFPFMPMRAESKKSSYL